jgi:hypothetical protein
MYVVAQFVEALRYKQPEGRWFDSRWFHWDFSIELTQPLTESVPGIFPVGKVDR